MGGINRHKMVVAECFVNMNGLYNIGQCQQNNIGILGHEQGLAAKRKISPRKLLAKWENIVMQWDLMVDYHDISR